MIISPKIHNLPVIDIMDAKNRGFQITISKEHGISRENLLKMEKTLGITQENPFKIYFIVPEFIFNEFKWKFEGNYSGLHQKEKELKKKTIEDLKIILKDKSFQKVIYQWQYPRISSFFLERVHIYNEFYHQKYNILILILYHSILYH